MKIFTSALFSIFLLAVPAFATVSVSSPGSGATVSSPATFVATATTSCSSGVASMGVYVDNALTTVVNGSSINTAVAMSAGTHNTVVEEWDRCGGATFTPINNLTVGGASRATTPGIPSYAVSSAYLNQSGGWAWSHDGGTGGGSTGYSSYPVGNPSMDGQARQFYVAYGNRGGEIYHVNFGTDENATHFVYDTYVYMADPGQVANIELDMNQVASNGATIIYGTQCSSYSGTWEFVTVSGGSPHWHPSNLSCSPQSWSAYTWHHVQIASHRDNSGNVTYDWVALDGDTRNFSGAYGYDQLFLGWGRGALVVNFQLDGAYWGSGSMNAYIDKMTIHRW